MRWLLALALLLPGCAGVASLEAAERTGCEALPSGDDQVVVQLLAPPGAEGDLVRAAFATAVVTAWEDRHRGQPVANAVAGPDGCAVMAMEFRGDLHVGARVTVSTGINDCDWEGSRRTGFQGGSVDIRLDLEEAACSHGDPPPPYIAVAMDVEGRGPVAVVTLSARVFVHFEERTLSPQATWEVWGAPADAETAARGNALPSANGTGPPPRLELAFAASGNYTVHARLRDGDREGSASAPVRIVRLDGPRDAPGGPAPLFWDDIERGAPGWAAQGATWLGGQELPASSGDGWRVTDAQAWSGNLSWASGAHEHWRGVLTTPAIDVPPGTSAATLSFALAGSSAGTLDVQLVQQGRVVAQATHEGLARDWARETLAAGVVPGQVHARFVYRHTTCVDQCPDALGFFIDDVRVA